MWLLGGSGDLMLVVVVVAVGEDVGGGGWGVSCSWFFVCLAIGDVVALVPSKWVGVGRLVL